MAELGTKARLRLCSTLKRLEHDESWGLGFLYIDLQVSLRGPTQRNVSNN